MADMLNSDFSRSRPRSVREGYCSSLPDGVSLPNRERKKIAPKQGIQVSMMLNNNNNINNNNKTALIIVKTITLKIINNTNNECNDNKDYRRSYFSN